MKPITITVYTSVEEWENPWKWDVAELFYDPNIVGWEIKDGHGDYEACKNETHEEG